MRVKDIKKKITSPKYFCATLLVLAICIYHMFFVRSVIPPQLGWWQYLGWRITEGDLLYKDVYCHVQPFFPWFVSVLYRIFDSNFVFYIIPGLLIRIIETLLVYDILTRITTPVISAFASFVSIIFTISTVYDLVFDYNTTILFLVVVEAYLLVKFYECYDTIPKRHIYCILSGLVAAIHFFTKQNTGTIVPFIVFVLIVLLSIKKERKEKIYINILLFFVSALVIVIPMCIYLVASGSFVDYVNCIIFGMSAKGSMLTKIQNVFHNMLNEYDIIITITIFLALYLKKYITSISQTINNIMSGYLLLVLLFCIKQRFGYAIQGLYEAIRMSPKKIIFAIMILILITIFSLVGKKLIDFILKKKNGYYYLGIFAITIFSIVLFYWYNQETELHKTLFVSLDLVNIMNYAVYIVHYLFLMFWLKDTYRLIKKKDIQWEIYLFNTVVLALYLSHLLSATHDELFILPSSAFLLVILLNNFASSPLKSVLCVSSSFLFILLCFSQKMYIPYTWHGWGCESINDSNLVSTDIDGLKGFLLPEVTEEKYQAIINAILDNSDENDDVYQFPNITLFNVLTHRKIPTYMPIHYFDVCSDERAMEDAKYLQENLPKIIIWDEMGEDAWNLHESIYRGGEQSGQRKIQEFYYTTVQTKYDLITSVDNNRYGVIEVWALKE